MNSSRNNWMLALMGSTNTVFNSDSIRVRFGDILPKNFSVLLNRMVRAGNIVNPRKGIYAKQNYLKEEMAEKIYSPSYISLEYVLQRAGIIFQYSEAVTCVSYLNRSIEVDGVDYTYRRIKGDIMIDLIGIENKGTYSIATPERALLDTLYLNSNYTFDNINTLNQNLIYSILPIYKNKSLEQRVNKLFKSLPYGHQQA